MADRFDYAAALLERRQRERRGTGAVSGRTERRDRQRMQALAMHLGVFPTDDIESSASVSAAGMQGPTPVQLPGDQWTQWEVTPSYGGRSGRRMSDVARYNAEANLMQVRFDSGGRGGVPNTYQYSFIDPETWDNFMAGRWSENGTVTAWFLTSWGGVRV